MQTNLFLDCEICKTWILQQETYNNMATKWKILSYLLWLFRSCFDHWILNFDFGTWWFFWIPLAQNFGVALITRIWLNSFEFRSFGDMVLYVDLRETNFVFGLKLKNKLKSNLKRAMIDLYLIFWLSSWINRYSVLPLSWPAPPRAIWACQYTPGSRYTSVPD